MPRSYQRRGKGRTIKLVVVGLGYVGLPLAREAVLSGHQVTGLDTSVSAVEALSRASSQVDDIPTSDIRAMLAGGFVATVDPSCLAQADVVVICVPTPLQHDGGPDLSAVAAAATTLATYLRRGTLVVLESTVPPGTTDGLVRGLLESGGLRCGVDFNLAFSPERIDPGNKRFVLRNTPKIVGGVTQACGERAAEFYRTVVDTVVAVPRAREAELTKLLENTYRHLNIALVNEMARICHELDIDVWSVVDAAATKPFGFESFRPGPGVGGHCIPIDPNFLSFQVRQHLGEPFRLVELAQEINASMPAYVVERATKVLRRDGLDVVGARVLLIGVSYKRDVSDDRESPAAEIARILHEAGAVVTFHDPVIDTWGAVAVPVQRVADLSSALHDCDLAVLLQDHSAYDLEGIASTAPRLLDTRGKVHGPSVERL